MELKIHNDGKEKWQSFEAWVDGIDCERGYGSDEDEAIQDYSDKLGAVLDRITMAQMATKDKSTERVYVDCFGNELGKSTGH